MKFSILVPVYNVEKYLEQCVESLLNQTYKGEYEIILVDDGSTDSSGMLCDRYAENNPDKIKVVHKENGGLVSARQAGIEIAVGEYSLFVDSDDFVENNLLETIDRIISSNSETDIVIFSMNYYKGTTKTPKKNLFRQKETVFLKDDKKELYEALITTTFINSLCLKAVKTDVLKNDPTDYSLYYDKNMAEDWFRSIQLITAAEKIVYINKHLYNYRTNEASISRSFRPETIAKKNILYVYDRFMEYLPKWGMDTEEYRQKLNARWLGEVMYTFSSYYESVSAKDRKAVLEYNWSSMLPEAVLNEKNNPHENIVNRSLFCNLTNKKFFRVRIYFVKKKARKLIKKLLKRGK
ncbi:MAG: glycosyltransferase family 2 protein [Clostridia bacterium]|nr:glycosyltransferase family 2 protein [Clostridia bacterium]